MSRPARAALVALGLLTAVASPAAGQTRRTDAWLQRAARAPAAVSYQGTKVVMLWSGSQTAASTVHVDHLAPDRYRLEYGPTPGRSRRLVIDDGKTRWQYEPAARLAIRSASPTLGDDGVALDRLSLLRANYTITLAGEDRVAGRDAVVIAVRPRAGARPALVLWLDRDTGLVLRSERRHADGSLAQVAAFTSIEYRDPPADRFAFAPPRGITVRALPSGEPLRVADVAPRMGFQPIAPAALPGGFVLDRVLASGSSATGVAVMQYTDGLAALSLFEHRAIEGARRILRPASPAPVADRRVAARQIGDMAVIHWQVRGVDMTLTGDLAPEHLERIAQRLGIEEPPGRVARLKFWLASLWKHILNAM